MSQIVIHTEAMDTELTKGIIDEMINKLAKWIEKNPFNTLILVTKLIPSLKALESGENINYEISKGDVEYFVEQTKTNPILKSIVEENPYYIELDKLEINQKDSHETITSPIERYIYYYRELSKDMIRKAVAETES